MKQLHDIVGFKSFPPFWTIEADGRKANTVRWITEYELEWFKKERPSEIFMRNTATKECFTRKITNFLILERKHGEVCVLISWAHEPITYIPTHEPYDFYTF